MIDLQIITDVILGKGVLGRRLEEVPEDEPEVQVSRRCLWLGRLVLSASGELLNSLLSLPPLETVSFRPGVHTACPTQRVSHPLGTHPAHVSPPLSPSRCAHTRCNLHS